MTKFVTDYLAQEHQTLSALLSELHQQLGVLRLSQDRGRTEERLTGLQGKIAEALRSHVVEEEQILYPALEKHVQGITCTLDRMRQEHDTGDQTRKTFHENLDRMIQGTGDPQEVMQSGRLYITWLRRHLMEENGRLFPMIQRSLDPATQQVVRTAMELSRDSSAGVAEAQPYSATA